MGWTQIIKNNGTSLVVRVLEVIRVVEVVRVALEKMVVIGGGG